MRNNIATHREFWEYFFLTVLLFLAFYLRIWNIGESSFWLNEADHSRVLEFSTIRDKIAYSGSATGLYLPDIFYENLFQFIFTNRFTDGDEGDLRLSSAFACVASIPLVFKLAKQLCEYKMAWIVTISWAMNPFAIELSRQYFLYTNMPIWAMMLILTTFRLSDSLSSGIASKKDWFFFHISMVISITSNLFNFLLVFALFPYFFTTVRKNQKTTLEKSRILATAYLPHLIPGSIVILSGFTAGMDPELNNNSWMPSATWSAPLELTTMAFPEPSRLAAVVIISLVFIRLLQRLNSNNNFDISEALFSQEAALFLCGTMQIIFFVFLQLLGQPSWVTRYMLHLVPLWIILAGLIISPKNFSLSGKKQIPIESSIVGQIGTIVMLCVAVLASFSIEPAPDSRSQDIRGAWEVVSEDYNSSENQVFLTNPSDFFYSYYIEMFDLEPDLVSGSWGDIPEDELTEALSSKPDSIHRIRLSSLDDSDLSFVLSQEYFLENKSETTGMVIEHWKRK